MVRGVEASAFMSILVFVGNGNRGAVKSAGGRGSGVVRFKRTVLRTSQEGAAVCLLSVVKRVRKRRYLPSASGAAGCRRILPHLTTVRSSRDMGNILLLLGAVNKSMRDKLTVTRVITSLSGPAISLILNKDRSVNIPLTISASCSFVIPDKAVIVRPMQVDKAIVKTGRACSCFGRVRSQVTKFITSRYRISRRQVARVVVGARVLAGSLNAVLIKGRTISRNVVSTIKKVSSTFTGLCRLVKRGDWGWLGGLVNSVLIWV